MAKRFTDTDKYKKQFFRGLPGAYKLFWDYLYHDCNHAGIWHKDFAIAQIYLGSDMAVEEKKALELFNQNEERIVVLNGGSKWFVKPFLSFQYGSLNPENKAHRSILQILSKEGLPSPLETAKDMDKDMDKDGSVSSKRHKQPSFQKPTPEEITTYASSVGFALDGQKFWDFYESKGWVIGKSPMKDWKRAVSTWKSNGYGGSNGRQAKDAGYATAQPGKYAD